MSSELTFWVPREDEMLWPLSSINDDPVLVEGVYSPWAERVGGKKEEVSGFALALFLVIYDFTKVHPEYQQYLLAITPLLVNEMIDDEQVRDSALDHLEKIFRRGQH